MKCICMLKKPAFIVAVYMVVLCASGCSESSKPTPEQIAERTNLLYHAVRNDDLEMIKACIEAGARVNAAYLSGYRINALFIAVDRKRADIAELLINAGADVNSWDKRDNDSSYWETVLMKAASSGSTDIAELLIKAGVDVNARTERGYTALRYAKWKGHTDIAELLRAAGAEE